MQARGHFNATKNVWKWEKGLALPRSLLDFVYFLLKPFFVVISHFLKIKSIQFKSMSARTIRRYPFT